MDGKAQVEEAVNDVAVVITTIPDRSDMLKEAVASVLDQTVQPDELIVVCDKHGNGAWHTRNRGLFKVRSKWTAFLDDDDMMYPNHLEALLNYAESTGADLVYPWFDGLNAEGILYMGRKQPEGHDPEPELLMHSNWIPITYLVDTEFAQSVGGFPALKSDRWPHDNCEDWGFLQDMYKAGAKFAHLPERTWKWRNHGNHTSGKPWK